jgi:hypothetical protein
VSSRLVLPNHSFLSPTSPFPTRWLPRVGSPLFLRYYEDAKTSDCSSPRSWFPSNDGYLLDSISFARLGLVELLPLRLGVGLPVSPHAPVLSPGGSQSDLSSSQGTLRAFALLSDPGRISTPSLLRRFDSAPAVQTTKAPTSGHYFEAQSHGFSSRSIRFVPASLPTTQCSLPAGGQPLPGGILYPLGPCIVFPSLVFYSITCSSSHSGFT